MQTIQSEAGNIVLDVSGMEIERHGDYFHYIDHASEIATMGFASVEGLRNWGGNILAGPGQVHLMKQRYQRIFTA